MRRARQDTAPAAVAVSSRVTAFAHVAGRLRRIGALPVGELWRTKTGTVWNVVADYRRRLRGSLRKLSSLARLGTAEPAPSLKSCRHDDLPIDELPPHLMAVRGSHEVVKEAALRAPTRGHCQEALRRGVSHSRPLSRDIIEGADGTIIILPTGPGWRECEDPNTETGQRRARVRNVACVGFCKTLIRGFPSLRSGQAASPTVAS